MSEDPEKQHEQLQSMSFGDHLEVLRSMLMRIALVVVALIVVFFGFKDETFRMLLAPKEYDFVTFRWIEKILHLLGSDFAFEPYHVNLISTEVSGQFMAHVNYSLYLALLAASPYILAEVFRFILPALYSNERKYSVYTVVVMYLLFVLGILMSYFILFPISFRFLGTYQVDVNIPNTITIDSYLSFFSSLTFMMGLVFQLPVMCFFLSKIGILTSAAMSRYRRHAFVVIMIVAAFITPPDLLTMVLVTVPLYLLYELSLRVIK